VPHRLETIAVRDRVRWVNDSQATIPAAAIAALASFDEPIVLIAGGKDKGMDYTAFADAIAARARAAVLLGETADVLAGLIGDRVPIERTASMEEAVAVATRLSRPGDVVLLAPAAASFDLFVDYAARGDAFRVAVTGEAGQ
jgi:UDP-N-acetylmuramoylalanine--D-glutamate ligase